MGCGLGLGLAVRVGGGVTARVRLGPCALTRDRSLETRTFADLMSPWSRPISSWRWTRARAMPVATASTSAAARKGRGGQPSSNCRSCITQRGTPRR